MDFSTSPAIESSALPTDSVERVKEMCRLRRERQVVEHQIWEQDSRVQQEHERFVLEMTSTLEDDEMAARATVSRAEERAFGRLIENARNGAESLAPTNLSEESRRRQQLQKAVQRSTFRQFWQTHTSGTTIPQNSHDADVRARRDAVAVLRRSYAHSAPKFAADPEDLWRRGITVAPDAQQSACDDKAAQFLHLPAYHEFALTLRSRYAAERGLQ